MLSAGQRLGPYRLVRPLGEGAMGVVYLAEHESLARPAAIKLLRPGTESDAELVQRFHREMQLSSRFAHPNLVRVFDGGELDGVLYIAMELIDGQPLHALVGQSRKLPWARAAELVRGVAEGLDYLHAHDVLHRDVKLSNILLGTDGVPRLVDYGLAYKAHATRLTVPGGLVGTLSFLAPELFLGHPASRQSDLWSLGCVLYACLAGRLHVRSVRLEDLLRELLEPIALPDAVRAATPPAIQQVLASLLDRNPALRPVTAGEVARALADCREGRPPRRPARKPPSPPPPPLAVAFDADAPTAKLAAGSPPPSPGSSKWARALVGGAALLVPVALVLALGGPPRRPEPPAWTTVAAPPAPRPRDAEVAAKLDAAWLPLAARKNALYHDANDVTLPAPELRARLEPFFADADAFVAKGEPYLARSALPSELLMAELPLYRLLADLQDLDQQVLLRPEGEGVLATAGYLKAVRRLDLALSESGNGAARVLQKSLLPVARALRRPGHAADDAEVALAAESAADELISIFHESPSVELVLRTRACRFFRHAGRRQHADFQAREQRAVERMRALLDLLRATHDLRGGTRAAGFARTPRLQDALEDALATLLLLAADGSLGRPERCAALTAVLDLCDAAGGWWWLGATGRDPELAHLRDSAPTLAPSLDQAHRATLSRVLAAAP